VSGEDESNPLIWNSIFVKRLINRKAAKDAKMDENEWSNKIIGTCIEVHRALGLGLLESVYQECLAREFSLQDVPFQFD